MQHKTIYRHTSFFCAFALLCLTDVACFTKWRQEPPPEKKDYSSLTTLQWLLCCGGLETALQHLRSACNKVRRRLASEQVQWLFSGTSLKKDFKCKQAWEKSCFQSFLLTCMWLILNPKERNYETRVKWGQHEVAERAERLWMQALNITSSWLSVHPVLDHFLISWMKQSHPISEDYVK